MDLLASMMLAGHDRVMAVQDRNSGLNAWIALHQMRRGPAYGGVRVWHYRGEDEAMRDALRLAQAMTYKCVLAGVPGSGGKTVVMVDRLRDREQAMVVLGQVIESLGGAYQAGPDVGFTAADEAALRRSTTHVASFGGETGLGGVRTAGEATAEGAEWGIRAALAHLGTDTLEGATVALQGVGAVGRALARRLLAAGVRVIAADPDSVAAAAAADMGVEMVDPDGLLDVECDVLAPCALGGVLHDISIPRLRTRVVAGVANNVLAAPSHADRLGERDILFVPDFVLNAGALIEGSGYARTGRRDWSEALQGIGTTVSAVLRRADAESRSTVEAALLTAQERIDADDELVESS
jgi:leucine dehydrogenase